jgi:hypothetical protein
MTMPRLDWTNSGARANPAWPKEGQAAAPRLSLEVAPELLGKLREELAPVLREGGELRLELPEGWTLFWKRRDGESRVLLAHPETDRWVATLAVSGERVEDVLSGLEGLRGSGDRLDLGPAAGSGSTSNLEIELVLV